MRPLLAQRVILAPPADKGLLALRWLSLITQHTLEMKPLLARIALNHRHFLLAPTEAELSLRWGINCVLPNIYVILELRLLPKSHAQGKLPQFSCRVSSLLLSFHLCLSHNVKQTPAPEIESTYHNRILPWVLETGKTMQQRAEVSTLLFPGRNMRNQ